MAVTLAQVVAGIKARLDTVPGLNVYDHPPATPNLPAAVIMPPPIDYRQAMKIGAVRLDFEIHLLVGTSAGHEQSKTLWPYLEWATGSPSSVFRALDADKTLTLADVSSAVLSARPLGLEEMPPFGPETGVFGAALALTVVVTNKE